MSKKLPIIKTDERKEKWRKLRNKLEEQGYKNVSSISKRLDKAVELALWTLDKRKEEIEEVKSEWELP